MFYIVKNSLSQNPDFLWQIIHVVSELFFDKFLEILTIESLKIGKFLQKQTVSIFRANAHALSFDNKEKAENCWVLCVDTFSNKSLQ